MPNRRKAPIFLLESAGDKNVDIDSRKPSGCLLIIKGSRFFAKARPSATRPEAGLPKRE